MPGAVTLGRAHPECHPTVRGCKSALGLVVTAADTLHAHRSSLCRQAGRREVRKPDPDNSSDCCNPLASVQSNTAISKRVYLKGHRPGRGCVDRAEPRRKGQKQRSRAREGRPACRLPVLSTGEHSLIADRAAIAAFRKWASLRPCRGIRQGSKQGASPLSQRGPSGKPCEGVRATTSRQNAFLLFNAQGDSGRAFGLTGSKLPIQAAPPERCCNRWCIQHCGS